MNEAVRKAWNENAEWWDQAAGDADTFHRWLIFPAIDALLAPSPGQRILEIACGNGNLARRLARAGAGVVAVDFAEELLDRARARPVDGPGTIDYRYLDATDPGQLAALGRHAFDAAVASMALHDMAEIDPLLNALPVLLRPEGRFVFAIPHPCFNTPRTATFTETTYGAHWETTAGVKVSDYLAEFCQDACVKHGQPRAHPVFHRPLGLLFGRCFRAGLVLDGMIEPVPPAEMKAADPESWHRLTKIPPVLAARWRPASRSI
jgi:ubiquinone/menaquinone biosynthesis C-methylase UbiE